MRLKIHAVLDTGTHESNSKQVNQIITKIQRLEQERYNINLNRHRIIDSYQEHRTIRKCDKDMEAMRRRREGIYRDIKKLQKRLHKLLKEKHEDRTLSLLD